MLQSSKVVPIIVMTRNEGKYIEECVASLLDTDFPNLLIIVDNASTDQLHIDALARISKNVNVHVIQSDTNRWINNLDYAFSYIQKLDLDFEFFSLTDGDIVVSKFAGDWLETLVTQLSENLWLGKLGASINLDNINNVDMMSRISESELLYYSKKIAPDIFLAPVDTTLAVYRKDVFVYRDLKFRPGHMSAIRPYYHVGRSAKVHIIHRGWEEYSDDGVGIDKVKAFSKFGAHIQWDHFDGTFYQKFYYKAVSKFYRVFWGVGLGWAHIRYVFGSRLIRQNKLYEQSKFRNK